MLIFDVDRAKACDLDDGWGGSVGIDNHMRYIIEESGTPDGDVASLDDYQDAEHFFSTFSEKDNYFFDDYGNEYTPDDIYSYYEANNE